ncbi:carbon-nitrogen hydrolase family protein [Thalassotalea sp. HSM 43]|uniref:carbon-nitrogen hydrolase family protein n=1 Tax=Thalassotalea sp. HSM 43 TaxID=2552945 RepID=UPI001080B4E1|nr:carbon-nitrogen hydrolase family protein [Thalassotalea sp. HSM 43]QBY04515.1 carbon-nitrogen hydrolase family protein [Thalassotalea sp. HSM 43]
MIRVAAAQYAVTNDVAANLANSVRMIHEAGKCSPDLIVLPEFANHNSWYDNQDHCYQVSVDIDGEFSQAIAQAAKQVGAYVVINCTVRRQGNRATGTSLLFTPDGELVAENNKQVLIGHENDFLDIAEQQGPIVDTDIGRLAMYSCMDGVINETPRCLALRGAQILCNSLNSFAIDEGTLHIPVRAAENKVFVVAANKVGPLIPEEMLEPVSQGINIPVEFLSGAGDSQIVAPDGTVLALAGKGEEVIWADIEPSQADDKSRPDGSDIFANRRNELYAILGNDPQTQTLPEFGGAIDVDAAIVASDSIAEVIQQTQQLINNGNKLIALPELFWCESGSQPDMLAQESEQLLLALQQICPADVYIGLSIVAKHGNGYQHQGVIVSQQGVVHRQGQVHASKRHDWSIPADEFKVFHSPYGSLAVIVEDDAIYPETFRLVAMQGVQLVFASLQQQEAWQGVTGIIERASENRVNVLAASTACEDSLICSLQKDFTIMTPWQERQFDGLLSQCQVVRGNQSPICAQVHPQAAANKVVSHRTHLIDNRPWRLMSAMLD